MAIDDEKKIEIFIFLCCFAVNYVTFYLCSPVQYSCRSLSLPLSFLCHSVKRFVIWLLFFFALLSNLLLLHLSRAQLNFFSVFSFRQIFKLFFFSQFIQCNMYIKYSLTPLLVPPPPPSLPIPMPSLVAANATVSKETSCRRTNAHTYTSYEQQRD